MISVTLAVTIVWKTSPWIYLNIENSVIVLLKYNKSVYYNIKESILIV